MITSTFNKQTNILESEFIGDTTLNDILNYIIAIENNKTYPRLLKIKINAAQVNFTFSIKDLEKIAIERNKLAEKYDFIIASIIVANPKATVISMLYKELDIAEKYKFNLFSTDEGAIKWLKTTKQSVLIS